MKEVAYERTGVVSFKRVERRTKPSIIRRIQSCPEDRIIADNLILL